MKSRVRELSKGMVTQLHLALILAIDARLLVLDEPTLGLDLLYRRQFYDTLLNDYFDKERTILLTTHQVEEVENLLHRRDVHQPRRRWCWRVSVEDLGERYLQLTVSAEHAAPARALQAFLRARNIRPRGLFFEGAQRRGARALGELRTPSIADLFVAKMQGARSHEHRNRRPAHRPGERGRRQRHARHPAHADAARVLGAHRAVARPADRRRPAGDLNDLLGEHRRAQ